MIGPRKVADFLEKPRTSGHITAKIAHDDYLVARADTSGLDAESDSLVWCTFATMVSTTRSTDAVLFVSQTWRIAAALLVVPTTARSPLTSQFVF